MDSPSSNARLCSGERLADQITTSRGPNSLPTTYIYIYTHTSLSLSPRVRHDPDVNGCATEENGKRLADHLA